MASRSPLSQLVLSMGPEGPLKTGRRIDLIRALIRTDLTQPGALLELHEALCFLRAYPGDRTELIVVEAALRAFDRRPDVARQKARLADTGVAGTAIHYRFFWPMARWLAAKWPRRLCIDWEALEDDGPLGAILPALVTPAERPWLLKSDLDPRAVLGRLCPLGQSDGAYLVRRFDEWSAEDRVKEAVHDGLDLPYRLEPGPGGPSRTTARAPRVRPVFGRRPWGRGRPDLKAELLRAPRSVEVAPAKEGQALIDLALEAMVTRARDLEVFGFGDPRAVLRIDDGDGFELAVIGFRPERRLFFQAAFGLVSLQNGVPIGYVQADLFGPRCEISFNTFPTFRGGESARVFARVLAACHHVFFARVFSIEPYQLGDHNDEALDSGAWWFYQKLGFHPLDPKTRKLEHQELAKMKARPGHRSSRKILAALAKTHLYWSADPKGATVHRPFEPYAEAATEWFKATGLDRAQAVDQAERAIAERLGLRGLSPDERMMLRRWAPYLMTRSVIDRASKEDRRALGELLKAKAGRSEVPYLEQLALHPKLLQLLIG